MSLRLPVRQMAHEMHQSLQISHHIACLHETSNHRLWYPHFSLAWFGVAPRTFVLNERDGAFTADITDTDANTNLSAEETRRGLDEHYKVANIRIPDSHVSLSTPVIKRIPGIVKKSAYHFHLALPRLWRFRAVLRLRLGLSKVIRAIQHSSHLRHALKNAVGVALLSFLAFFPPGSAG